MSRRRVFPLVALVVIVASGCRSRERKTAPAVSAEPANSAASAVVAATRPYFVTAPERLTEAQAFVAEQVSSAAAAGERALVYVGASWCEPCELFHEAVERGELDDLLSGTRFVEF